MYAGTFEPALTTQHPQKQMSGTLYRAGRNTSPKETAGDFRRVLNYIIHTYVYQTKPPKGAPRSANYRRLSLKRLLFKRDTQRRRKKRTHLNVTLTLPVNAKRFKLQRNVSLYTHKLSTTNTCMYISQSNFVQKVHFRARYRRSRHTPCLPKVGAMSMLFFTPYFPSDVSDSSRHSLPSTPSKNYIKKNQIV